MNNITRKELKKASSTAEGYREVMRVLLEPSRRLHSMGMQLRPDGSVEFDWEYSNIPRKIFTTALSGHRITFAEQIALSIAVSEESRQGFVGEDDLEFVNKFFKISINREDIKKIGSQFI